MLFITIEPTTEETERATNGRNSIVALPAEFAACLLRSWTNSQTCVYSAPIDSIIGIFKNRVAWAAHSRISGQFLPIFNFISRKRKFRLIMGYELRMCERDGKSCSVAQLPSCEDSEEATSRRSSKKN